MIPSPCERWGSSDKVRAVVFALPTISSSLDVTVGILDGSVLLTHFNGCTQILDEKYHTLLLRFSKVTNSKLKKPKLE